MFLYFHRKLDCEQLRVKVKFWKQMGTEKKRRF